MVYSTEQYHMKQKIVEVLVFKEVIDIFWKSQLPTITFFFFHELLWLSIPNQI